MCVCVRCVIRCIASNRYTNEVNCVHSFGCITVLIVAMLIERRTNMPSVCTVHVSSGDNIVYRARLMLPIVMVVSAISLVDFHFSFVPRCPHFHVFKTNWVWGKVCFCCCWWCFLHFVRYTICSNFDDRFSRLEPMSPPPPSLLLAPAMATYIIMNVTFGCQ